MSVDNPNPEERPKHAPGTEGESKDLPHKFPADDPRDDRPDQASEAPAKPEGEDDS
jgi:hypothetical protein